MSDPRDNAISSGAPTPLVGVPQSNQPAVGSFCELAVQLNLLTPETAKELAAESLSKKVSPATIAKQSAILSATDIDIVETLLRPRETIPGYEIQSLLGKGGMGVVYRARQLSLNRIVALKTVLITHLGTGTVLQRFEREAQLIGKLLHPHIITAYDFGRHDGRLFLAMELVSGEDVEHLVTRAGPFDEAFTWGLIRQAASGLAYAASLGIVHRDIKPANLLLVEPPPGFPLPKGMKLVKIADFGLALLAESDEDRTRLTMAGTAMGSPLYMSPEQLEGEALDERTDLYALGITAWQLLVGQPPFAGQSLAKILASKLHGQVPDVRERAPQISAPSAALIADLVRRNPKERIRDYATLLARIDALALTNLPAHVSETVTVAHAPQHSVASTTESPSVARNQTAEVAETQLISPGAGINSGNAETQANRLTPASNARLLVSRRTMPWIAVAVVVVVAGVVFWNRRAMFRPGEPDCVSAGPDVSLFSGTGSNGWEATGAVRVAKDTEGAPVLEVADGSLTRSLDSLLKSPTDGDGFFFRVEFQFQLRNAKQIAIHFDGDDSLTPRSQEPLHRIALLSATELQIGRSHSSNQPPTIETTVPCVFDADKFHTFRIERHSAGWFLFLNDQFVGFVRPLQSPSRAQIRLQAIGSKVWFAEITCRLLARSQT